MLREEGFDECLRASDVCLPSHAHVDLEPVLHPFHEDRFRIGLLRPSSLVGCVTVYGAARERALAFTALIAAERARVEPLCGLTGGLDDLHYLTATSGSVDEAAVALGAFDELVVRRDVDASDQTWDLVQGRAFERKAEPSSDSTMSAPGHTSALVDGVVVVVGEVAVVLQWLVLGAGEMTVT